MNTKPVVVFDVGSTLIHPDFNSLCKWVTKSTGSVLSADNTERAFRLAVSGSIFLPPSVNIQSQANIFFTECGLTPRLNDKMARCLWEEIVNGGGTNSWLYTVVDHEATSTLTELKARGCRLIAASNSDGTLIAELDSFNLAELFDEIHDSSVLGMEKPCKTFYEAVLRSSKSMLSLHVGDDLINDCVAAATSGFNNVLLYDPIDLFSGLPSYMRITNLSEVIPASGLFNE